MLKLIAPCALAVGVLAAPACAQEMTVTKNGSQSASVGPAENFTGTALVEPTFSANDPFAVNGAKVTFLPGARSNWHTHPAGQVLVVTDGQGWVQEEGGPKHVIQAGDVVWTPPGVKHWHGGTDETALTHYAIQQFEDGEVVSWMEPVTDAQFLSDAD